MWEFCLVVLVSFGGLGGGGGVADDAICLL
jgi:hypothetical protein